MILVLCVCTTQSDYCTTGNKKSFSCCKVLMFYGHSLAADQPWWVGATAWLTTAETLLWHCGAHSIIMVLMQDMPGSITVMEKMAVKQARLCFVLPKVYCC